MRKPVLAVFTFTLALGACATDKDDAKGVVDDSEPPATPTALGKADSSTKVIPVDVQSVHPYTNNMNKTYSVPYTNLPSCASQVRVHFKVLRTEADYDYVTVEPTGSPVQSFDGSMDDTWTEWFAKSGTSAKVRLKTDSSVTFHGFEIDKLEWQGGVICPAIAYPSCAAGKIDVTPPTPVCGCPAARVCADETALQITHSTQAGFNLQVHAVSGNAATETHPGPTDAPVTTGIGTIDQAKLDTLVHHAAELGLLQGTGYTRTVPAGSTKEDFQIRIGAVNVKFSAAEGTQDAAVAQLIADFEALFACGGSSGALTCGSNLTCDADTSTCVEPPASCICPAIYQPVCGTNGHTYSNSCEAGCASAPVAHTGECGIVGDACGTIFGLTCQGDEKCRFGTSQFTYPFPDAGGRCVAASYCDAPADCNGLVHPAVLGGWQCNQNTCAYVAGPQWKPATDPVFETAHPYASSTSVWKEVSLPAGAQALRLVTTSFALEANYDFLEVWNWTNGQWVLAKRYTGTTGPAATDEFAGQYHYLRFVSDSSVNKQGFKVSAEWR